MPQAEHQTERKAKRAPGKSSPADFAFYGPRPPLKSFTKEFIQKKTPMRASQGFRRFFGASSVASALGIRSGATPRGPIHPNTPSPTGLPKPDISTLLAIGHFYFALTHDAIAHDQRGTDHSIPLYSVAASASLSIATDRPMSRGRISAIDRRAPGNVRTSLGSPFGFFSAERGRAQTARVPV